jgi:acryloyl-coenzyme A reductase
MRIELQEVGFDRDLAVVDSVDVEPGPGQVRVQLQASGVCHRDLIDRAGRIPFLSPPVVPGHEGVGIVDAVGDGVSDWAVGDRVATMHRDACGQCSPCKRGETSTCMLAAHVFGLTADGTYAAFVVAPQSAFYAMDMQVPASQAAVMHCTFGTAWRSLVTVGELVEGERVLITGANGGVGLAAVQIAARFARKVVAVVRSEGHEERLKALGATDVLVSPDNRFHKEADDVDLALDCVGAPTFNAALRSLRVGGRISVVGNITPERASLNLGLIITMGLRILGPGGATRTDMAAMLAENARNPFASIVAEERPLEAADEVQRRLLNGGLWGRTVLLP